MSRHSGSLTPTEEKVLESLCEGMLNRDIAADHNMAEATVKVHLKRIYDKLGYMNRSHAIAQELRKRSLSL